MKNKKFLWIVTLFFKGSLMFIVDFRSYPSSYISKITKKKKLCSNSPQKKTRNSIIILVIKCIILYVVEKNIKKSL